MSFVTVTAKKAFVEAVLEEQAQVRAAQAAEVERRVAAEIARLRDAAEARGRAEGHEAREAELAETAAALDAAVAAVRDMAGQLAAPLARKEQEVGDLVMELAFLLARHMLGGAPGDKKSLQRLLTKMLAEASQERGPRQNILVRVNPVDHARLAGAFEGADVNLLADGAITAGGAKLEIFAADGDPLDQVEWDATIEGRAAAMRAALMLPEAGA
jgi:flagellar biosynthesis/type III secretory pathway protein FliH